MRKKSKLPPPPPGPWKLPVIGNLHQLIMMSRHLQPYQVLSEFSKRYGAVVQLQLGEHSDILISSPEAAEQVLKTHHGDHWRQMRKLCTMELLSAKRALSFRSIRLQEVANLVASICASEGNPVDLKPMVISLTNSITSRSAFGNAPKQSANFFPVVESMVSSGGGFRVSDLFPSIGLIPVISGHRSNLVALHRAADSMLDEVINQHMENRARRRRRLQTSTEDLVDILLNFQENADHLDLPLTMDSMKAVLLNVFIGGADTTPGTIEWAMSEIMRNPEVMQRVQKEVRSVFRDEVDEEGLHKLEYLNAVIKETFRLHPAGPILPRESRESMEINGFHVPQKSRIMINMWAIGRDPAYWGEAEKFNPERFLDSAIDYKGTHFTFLPFGGGRRMCPAIQFAMPIVELTLANLLFHFDWKLPCDMRPEDLDMTEHFDTAIRRKEKLCLIPTTTTSARPSRLG
ncbi:unnamed protein product [Linum tenue]|uniref:Cytochrome P450 n=3 Tax=Linum tenue TaxID=586396 RepID=A0AAV0JDI9_9ROSI|nr:unnamed protein product [Linum tenue]